MAQLMPVPSYDEDAVGEDVRDEGPRASTSAFEAAMRWFSTAMAEAAQRLGAAFEASSREGADEVEPQAGEPRKSPQELAADLRRAAEAAREATRSLAGAVEAARGEVLRYSAEVLDLLASEGRRWVTEVAAAGQDARRALIEAGGKAPRPAHEVIERLESDYRALRGLLDEMKERIPGGAASPPTEPTWVDAEDPGASPPLAPAAADVRRGAESAPQEESSWRPHVLPVSGEEEALPPLPDEDQAPGRAAAEAPKEVGLPPPGASPGAAVWSSGSPEAAVLAGRVVLVAAPIPDFDRLLTVDAALGRMSCVRNVTLADYAKDEVSFRVELRGAVEAAEFVLELARLTGLVLEARFAGPASLRLRVAPGA